MKTRHLMLFTLLALAGTWGAGGADPAAVQRRELEEAVAALLAGRSPADRQNPSMGCSIKWK